MSFLEGHATDLLLFSYGSNGPARLSERIGRGVRGEAAYVSDFQRVFRGHSRNWGGAVASLEPKRGATTFGWVARVSRSDLDRLDRFEGVHSGKYTRKMFTVSFADGRKGHAIAYVSLSNQPGRPTAAYLQAVADTVGAFWKNRDGSTIRPSDFPIR